MSVGRSRNSRAGLSHSKVDVLDHHSRSNEWKWSTGEHGLRSPCGSRHTLGRGRESGLPGEPPVHPGQMKWDHWGLVLMLSARATPSLGWHSGWDFSVVSSVEFLQGELGCKFFQLHSPWPWPQPRSADAAEQTTDLSPSET